jgi:hypothetical protein
MSGRAVFLWVVIPFVTLSALALWLTRAPVTPSESTLEEEPVPAPRPAPTPARPPPVRTQAPLPSPSPSALQEEEEPLPELPPGTWTKDEVRQALRSIQPLVHECMADASGRHRGPQTVELRFTLEAQGERGRFQRGEVVESSVVDPFFNACLLDTLADAQFSAPSGRPPLTLTHSFHFNPR